ncbi:MAG: RNA methyltransferase [Bacteroidetes bacterium GWF2_42_66]|nr:MAG: RNA methyltransferase [Bacteroidetes bacterium GWA2_42_15]OFX99909.1 MAG: RNA methyltransferase [Bacteroidetes bacterium GWE2_42_39]OFY40094.1 MAG: RNA methyltransferase [Bacteroidetes bacterium GWF2_42_66]HAZ00610.1 RNA methyltransferase [Marinilabiliales bacterium]HBL73915.1 RNA methyltransferase [Prolixibacteraceae bacterium]
MLSKNKIKFIQSLDRKRIREEHGVFLAEGNKLVEEALASGFEIELLVCTGDFFSKRNIDPASASEIIITDKENIKKASLLQSPQETLAVIKKPSPAVSEIKCAGRLSLALDCIQDPGNLGTILRIANWFGIDQIICSRDTVDGYNPKVVQASMGAIFRVKLVHTELLDFLQHEKELGCPVYGAFLDGKNIYWQQLSPTGILVMGNEGNGISSEIEPLISERLFIPSFAENNSKPESLNVAVATAICCSEFRRR